MSTIAIIGIGAIGSVVAAALIESKGPEVILCARRSFSKIIVQCADESAEYPVTPMIDERQAYRCEWVLLCTKAHQTASATRWLRATCGPNSKIAVLQNGVDHVDRVRPIIADAPIIPVIVRCPVRPLAPGRVKQQGPAILTVADDSFGREFKTLFDGTRISVTLTSDLITDAWHKLCQNAANGALCALTLQPISVFRNPSIAKLAKTIIKEVIAVGRAQGAKLDDSVAEHIVAQFQAIPGAEEHGNSMYYDPLAGRPMEIEARNEVVVRLGAKHGIPTPTNSALCALLRAVDGQPITAA